MNPTQAMLSAIERDQGGVAVVWCPDLGLRDWLVEEVRGLAGPEASPFRTSSVDEAIDAPDRMALLVPNDEQEVVDELDGRRDQLLAEPLRTQPVILFLLRDGEGRVALANAPSLSSWVRGSEVDPDRLAAVDLAADRARFADEVGRSVGPTLDHEPAVRVPLPAVGPAGALDWLFSTVIPAWEPAPWPEVLAARSPTAAGHRAP